MSISPDDDYNVRQEVSNVNVGNREGPMGRTGPVRQDEEKCVERAVLQVAFIRILALY